MMELALALLEMIFWAIVVYAMLFAVVLCLRKMR